MEVKIEIEHRKPCKELTEYVRKISVFKSIGEIKYRQKITPTPFCYLAFNFGDIGDNIINSKKITGIKKYHFDGPIITDDYFIEYNGYLDRILVEFKASGYYYLFNSSPSEKVNTIFDFNLDEQDDSISSLTMVSDTEKRLELVENYLVRKASNALRFNSRIEESLTLLEKNHGNISVKELCTGIGLSERHFNRMFKNIIGISPKQYAKLLQLHYIISYMGTKDEVIIQKLANDAKFYDASHFINRFKELTGYSPKDFLKSDTHIALKYFT